MNAARDVVRDGAVLVEDDRIAAIGAFADLHAEHPTAAVVGDADAVITPGYVNAHQHLTGDRLVHSSIPDAIDSQDAIFRWAVPVHAAHTGDDDELSATLALAEALGNGVTCTVEAGTVGHPERVAAAARALGARITIGRWGWDVEHGPWAAPATEVIERAADLIDLFAGDPLVTPWVTLVGHDLMSDDLVGRASELAVARGTRLTFHMSPSPSDAVAFLARTGRRPLVHLDALGVLGPHVLVAHAVHLDDAEADVVLATRTAIASCPWAYLRLAQGFTAGGRHGDLLRRGARIALGCDAENAGDAVDVLRAAALFVGLVRDQTLDPFSVTAQDALELATIRGAEAIGMADRIGSLEVGKQADVVVHDTSGLQWQPPSDDPVLQLVWSSDGRSVRDVLVAGAVVVRNGRCTQVDIEAARAAARGRRAILLEHVDRPRPAPRSD